MIVMCAWSAPCWCQPSAADRSVGELADSVGRDYTTVSRQVAKLESLGLIARRAGKTDRGVTEAVVTETVGNAGRGSRAGGREGARGLEGA